MGGVGSGGVCSGWCLLRVVSAPEGVSALGESGGCLLGGLVSQHALRQTSPPVDRHTPVKT